jgi:hypothetical protein
MYFHNPVSRSMPPLVADERAALCGQLDFHRATILTKLDGLTDEQAAQIMVPSGVSLLALLKHLVFGEHFWYLRVFAGLDEAGPYATDPTEPDGSSGWRVEPADTLAAVADDYLLACQRSREIVADAVSLDEVAITPWGEPIDLRGITVHMIEETARHNGHADILRELIDGTTGF